MWVEVEGSWELNQWKEAEASVWEGAEMSLGLDRRRRSSFSDNKQAKATTASKSNDGKSDDEQAKVTMSKQKWWRASKRDEYGERFGGDGGLIWRDRRQWVRRKGLLRMGSVLGSLWMASLIDNRIGWAMRERVREREKKLRKREKWNKKKMDWGSY